MSVKVMGLVWDIELPRNEKFILLAYADHANHEGKNVYPSIKLIAKKTGYDHRSVQRITRKLEDRGLLLEDGKGPKGTKRWRIPIDIGDDKLSPVHVASGDKTTGEGMTKAVDMGDIAMSSEPSLTTIEPLKDSGNDKKPRKRDLLFDAIAEVCCVDPKTAGSSIAKVRHKLGDAGYSPEDVYKFKKLWWKDSWRQKPPTLWKLQEQIGIVKNMGQSPIDAYRKVSA